MRIRSELKHFNSLPLGCTLNHAKKTAHSKFSLKTFRGPFPVRISFDDPTQTSFTGTSSPHYLGQRPLNIYRSKRQYKLAELFQVQYQAFLSLSIQFSELFELTVPII